MPAANKSFSPLYLITKEMVQTKALVDSIHFLLDCGIDLIQYRQKNLSETTKIKQANKLKKITEQFDATLIINDDAVLAKKIDAGGVHLGKGDSKISVAHKMINQKNDIKKSIGISCYNDIKRVKKMMTNPMVDMISIGAIFPSKTKPNAKRANLEFIKEVLALKNQLKSNQKIYAIGGITHQNFSKLIDISVGSTRLDGVCLCADLFDKKRSVLKKRIEVIHRYFNQLNKTKR